MEEVLDDEMQRWPAEDEVPAFALGSLRLMMAQSCAFQNLVIETRVSVPVSWLDPLLHAEREVEHVRILIAEDETLLAEATPHVPKIDQMCSNVFECSFKLEGLLEDVEDRPPDT